MNQPPVLSWLKNVADLGESWKSGVQINLKPGNKTVNTRVTQALQTWVEQADISGAVMWYKQNGDALQHFLKCLNQSGLSLVKAGWQH